MIRVVLFDIDDTLLDFDKCARLSIERSFRRFGLPFREQVVDVFHEINNELWRRIETGALTRDGLFQIRWNLILERLGIEADGVALERCFVDELHVCAEPVDGAVETLRYLSEKYRIGVASNATTAQQVNRLKLAGMYPYIRDLFISETLGVQKPNPLFFERCLERLSPVRADETLLVGDSLSADVRGGLDAGLRVCWFDPALRPVPPDIRPDFHIGALADLRTLL